MIGLKMPEKRQGIFDVSFRITCQCHVHHHPAELMVHGMTAGMDCFQTGMTPLQHAAFKGRADICQLLLNNGADVNSNYHDNNYSTLHFAALSGVSTLFAL